MCLVNHLLIAADNAQRAKCERLEVGAPAEERHGLAPQLLPLARGCEHIQPRGGALQREPDPAFGEIEWPYQRVDVFELAPQQGKPSTRRGKHRVVTLGSDLLGAALVPSGRFGIAG